MKKRATVYYFGFPHYRQAILRELMRNDKVAISLISGTSSRAGIRTITEVNLPALSRFSTLTLGPFTWDKGAYSIVSTEDVDVAVLGPSLSSITTWLVLMHRRVTGRRTFLWGRCGHRGEISIRRLLTEIMNRLATGLLVYGERDLEGATSLGLERKRVTIVGNAVEGNSELWSQAASRRAFHRMQQRSQSAKHNGPFVLAHSGRLTTSKRPEILLEALGKIKLIYPNVHLHVIGDGPALNEMRQHEHAASVTFHGSVYDPGRLAAILESATIIVSAWDMGLLALDALRAGIPVLLPDNPQSGPEVEALTNGVNAQEFRAGDAESLAAAAIRWIETAASISEEEYVDSRCAALRFWDPSQVANAILRAIEN